MLSPQVLSTVALTLLASLVVSAPTGEEPTKTKEVVKRALYAGTPMGFASGVTGGGSGATVTATTAAQLKSYLESSTAYNIVISGTINFVGTEGTTTYQACDAYPCTPNNGGQALLNTLNACTKATYGVSIDNAGYRGINVKSNKTLVGRNGATLNGKGLRFSGVSNIIIQNVHITNLNPKYVWGGDALSFADSKNIWIDHVRTSSLGRQHYSFGQNPSNGITISNSFIDGRTSYSASCNGHTYWGLELVGTSDQITFYKNYVYYTSGRSPALSGNTLFHAVNNVFSSNAGHLIEGDSNGMGLFEGNHFTSVPTVLVSGFKGRIFGGSGSNLSACSSAIGRACVANSFSSSGSLTGTDTSFFNLFAGKNIPSAQAASSIASSVPASAGNTL